MALYHEIDVSRYARIMGVMKMANQILKKNILEVVDNQIKNNDIKGQ